MEANSPFGKKLKAMKRILFITSTRIGDCILSTGLLARLAEMHPEAKITVACGPLGAPVFRAAPGVERIIGVAKSPTGHRGHWLTLWREVTHDMFRLWYLAEEDLLREGNWYRLADTGQGLNRVQQAPGVSRAIHALLRRCQERLGSWVGSSVVHLGDHNVPNARAFRSFLPCFSQTSQPS